MHKLKFIAANIQQAKCVKDDILSAFNVSSFCLRIWSEVLCDFSAAVAVACKMSLKLNNSLTSHAPLLLCDTLF